VGTGKTTLCRYMMLKRSDTVDLALILNPRIDELELLASICDELGIKYPRKITIKDLLDRLNTSLLQRHADGRRTVLVIDEAQNLSREVLEQVRLLTNLETTKHKLLQIILIGQPELVNLLSRDDLRQLAQRITARYHLLPLSLGDAKEYIKYRLEVAGCERPIFTRMALRKIYRMSRGIPRLINIICDRALLGAYSKDRPTVNSRIVSLAAKEIFGPQKRRRKIGAVMGANIALLVILFAVLFTPLNNHIGSLTGPAGDIIKSTSKRISEVISNTSGTHDEQTDSGDSQESSALIIRSDDKADKFDLYIGNKNTGPLPSNTVELAVEHESNSIPLKDLLNTSLSFNSRAQSIIDLAAVWGKEMTVPRGGDPCVAVVYIGLACIEGVSTWEQIKSLNCPVMLFMQNGLINPLFIVLYELDQQVASVIFAGGRYKYQIEELSSLWDGNYLTLWQPPPLDDQVITPLSDVKDILWLRRAMLTLSSGGKPEFSERLGDSVFDLELQEQVQDFQRFHALEDDGIVGRDTLLRIDGALNTNNIPILTKSM